MYNTYTLRIWRTIFLTSTLKFCKNICKIKIGFNAIHLLHAVFTIKNYASNKSRYFTQHILFPPKFSRMATNYTCQKTLYLSGASRPNFNGVDIEKCVFDKTGVDFSGDTRGHPYAIFFALTPHLLSRRLF